MIWHSHTAADVLQELQVDPAMGLSEQEANERLKEYGKNSLDEQRPLPFRQALVQQLKSPLTILLIAVAVIVLILDVFKQVLKEVPTDWEQALFVAALAIVSTLVGATLRYRATSAVSLLRNLSAPDTRVRRDGRDTVCPTHTLVPGDVVLLKVGDMVPADCRLIETNALRCDEGTLTDATAPAEKDANTLYENITPLAQRTNMVYAGTVITAGTATAVVVATGIRSEMGRTRPVSQKTPTQNKKVRLLSLWWNGIAVLLGILALIVGLVQHADRSAVLLTAAALIPALVPQNMDSLLTLLSVRTVKRMARHRVRLHRPGAAETLGRVTVFCTEQETLVKGGDIQLHRAFAGHQQVDLSGADPATPGLGHLLRLAALNAYDNTPADRAVLECAGRLGIHRADLLVDMPCIGELTDSNAHKTGVHLAGEQTLILVTGDWRTLLPLCTKGNIEELTAAATKMEESGLMVKAVTYRLTDVAPSVYTVEELEHDLTCVGLLGFQVSLQQDVSDAVTLLPKLRTIVFSNEPTASAAAATMQAGVTYAPCVATADTVETLTEEEWPTAVEKYNVYCGLTPAQKQRIVSALQAQGHVVAVTGCRSEDAALLTAADVSFARGSAAADVTKSAADVILPDDNYVSAIATIWEGKQLKTQRRCAIAYLIGCAVVMAGIGLSSLFGWTHLHRQAVLLMGLHLLLMDVLPSALVFIGDFLTKKK